jgi:hypothetical protein
MNWKNRIRSLNIWAGKVPGVQASNCPTRQRLAEAFSGLQNIQLVRNHRQDPLFGRYVEDRMIWRELLDLELQDVDEQMQRILAATEERSD